MSWWKELGEYFDQYVVELFRGMTFPPPAFWVALSLGAAIAYVLWRSRHNYERLTALEAAPEGFEPDLTVVIPARNEAANITAVVQSFPGLPVIVVDDDSSDETTKLAREVGATVIAAPPLKKTHLGKPAACWAGARQSHTKWILFVDADTRYESGAAAALVHFADTNKLDGVSMFLKQQLVTMPERMILPYAFALYFCGVSGHNLNRTKGSDVLANGQCFLVKRESYEYVGGHGAVSESVIEDVALARAFRFQRKKLRVVRGERFGSVRMYDSFLTIWKGFQKHSFRFLLISPWTGFQVVISSLLLTSWLPVLAWLLAGREWAAGAAFALLPTFMMRKWYGSLREALWVPAAIYVFQVIGLAGMYHASFGQTTEWKGRRV